MDGGYGFDLNQKLEFYDNFVESYEFLPIFSLILGKNHYTPTSPPPRKNEKSNEIFFVACIEQLGGQSLVVWNLLENPQKKVTCQKTPKIIVFWPFSTQNGGGCFEKSNNRSDEIFSVSVSPNTVLQDVLIRFAKFGPNS